MHSVVGYNTSILTSTSVAIAKIVTFKARAHILHIEYLLLEITHKITESWNRSAYCDSIIVGRIYQALNQCLEDAF